MFENKKFHLDMKENKRGRFVKVAEVSPEGRKNQIMMSLSTASVFSENLVQFIDFYHDLDKNYSDSSRQVNKPPLISIAQQVSILGGFEV